MEPRFEIGQKVVHTSREILIIVEVLKRSLQYFYKVERADGSLIENEIAEFELDEA